jgi:hypothetical protein
MRGARPAQTGWIAIGIALVAIAFSPAPASAASTRAEYVAQVDQTCTPFGPQFKKAGNTILKLGKRVVRLVTKIPSAPDPSSKAVLRKLNRLSQRISRAEQRFNGIFAAMVEGVAAVPPAPGDEAAVGQWINGLRQYVDFSARGSRAAKHGKLSKSLSFLEKSLTALDTGGAAVRDFGISVCPTSSESRLF